MQGIHLTASFREHYSCTSHENVIHLTVIHLYTTSVKR